MAKTLTAWTVLPHRPIERMTDAIMTVTGDIAMPLTTLERRMTVVRLAGGRLVVYSAIALDDATMAAIEAFGAPAFLVVPNPFHRNDARVWKERYPAMTVVAPSGARAKVAEVVPVDTSTPDFDDDAVRFVEVAGTSGREGALEVREHGTLTLVVNDVIGNLPKSDGLVLRALGFAADRPRVPRMAKRVLVADAAAFRDHLDAWSAEPVANILVSHGRPIREGAPDALREMARSL